MYTYYDSIHDNIDSNNIDQITDRIFLGGILARRSDLLTHYDIKHVIGLLTLQERHAISTEQVIVTREPEFRLEYKYDVVAACRTDGVHVENKFFDVEDSRATKILPIISTIKEYYDSVAPARVLIHCRMGISRSATVVLALLMHEGKSFKDAVNHVSGIRPVINPNGRFMLSLEELDTTLNQAQFADK